MHPYHLVTVHIFLVRIMLTCWTSRYEPPVDRWCHGTEPGHQGNQRGTWWPEEGHIRGYKYWRWFRISCRWTAAMFPENMKRTTTKIEKSKSNPENSITRSLYCTKHHNHQSAFVRLLINPVCHRRDLLQLLVTSIVTPRVQPRSSGWIERKKNSDVYIVFNVLYLYIHIALLAAHTNQNKYIYSYIVLSSIWFSRTGSAYIIGAI